MAKRLAIYLTVLALLAIASYFVTGIFWDALYLPVEIHVRITDEQGNPIEGVTFSTDNVEIPILDDKLISDENGEMVIHGNSGMYGGYDFDLFWIIPVKSERPNSICTFTHPDFEPFQVNYAEFHQEEVWVDPETTMYEHEGKTYKLMKVTRKVVMGKP